MLLLLLKWSVVTLTGVFAVVVVEVVSGDADWSIYAVVVVEVVSGDADWSICCCCC